MTDRIEAIQIGLTRAEFKILHAALHDPERPMQSAMTSNGARSVIYGLRSAIEEVIAARLSRALAPVAPDAESTEWVWSLDDVVQGDGHVWHRVGDGTHPWASGTANDQRDQDITDLVTKHGGRVLVCKARGIGVTRAVLDAEGPTC